MLLRFFSKVNPHTRTPVNAVWLIIFFSIALNLIGIGSTLIIVAIFNITAPALDLSYAIVILARNIYAHRIEFRLGPYTLGRLAEAAECHHHRLGVFHLRRAVVPDGSASYGVEYELCCRGGRGYSIFSLGWWWAGARKYVLSLVVVEILTPVGLYWSEDTGSTSKCCFG
jgi:hypothetical protein